MCPRRGFTGTRGRAMLYVEHRRDHRDVPGGPGSVPGPPPAQPLLLLSHNPAHLATVPSHRMLVRWTSSSGMFRRFAFMSTPSQILRVVGAVLGGAWKRKGGFGLPVAGDERQREAVLNWRSGGRPKPALPRRRDTPLPLQPGPVLPWQSAQGAMRISRCHQTAGLRPARQENPRHIAVSWMVGTEGDARANPRA